MTEIRFYHITKNAAETVVIELVERALIRNMKIVIRTSDDQTSKLMNDLLWSHKPSSFIPHSLASDKYASHQPITITHDEINANDADMLVIMPGAIATNVETYNLVCDILDGLDYEKIQQGRQRFKQWRDAGYELSYWQQSETGRWEQKS